MNNKNLLNLHTRQRIYQFISDAPGLHLREISRRTDISFSTLRYHLNYLCKNGLIEIGTEGRFNRYYKANNIGSEEKKLLNILRQAPIRKIILLMCLHTSPTLSEICHELQIVYKMPKDRVEVKYWKNPSSVYVHLQKLIELDIVERFEIGNEIRYVIKDMNKIYRLMISHKETFADDYLERVINWIENKYLKKGIVEKEVDFLLNKVLDIFPHPYHV